MLQELGVRTVSLGFYVKTVSDARRQEHAAQELLKSKTALMHQEVLEAVDDQKAALRAELASRLTDLQQQHAQELLTIQGLMANRMARASGMIWVQVR